MNRKILIASHHRMAFGLLDTLKYINPNIESIATLNAYLSNLPIEQEIEKSLENVNLGHDELIIFTDLPGGSVNQAFVPYLKYEHVQLISGMNLPLVLGVILSLPSDDNYLKPEELRKLIIEAKEQIVYVNDQFSNMELDEEDE